MPDWIVPLSDVRYRDEEIEAVAGAYRRGWLSQGPAVARFEAAFADSVGSPHAVAVASGTAALHLACVALGLGAGDEVVMPSLTFAATAAAVHHAGATPVFADIRDKRSPWLSADAAAAAIGERTRAIINVSYGGHPGEVLALRELARDRGLLLIEDAAHAVGASVGGQRVGAIGDVGAFSFFANKNLPLGEGGMLVTGDAPLAERARRLRSHGLTADTWSRHRGEVSGYDVLEPGFNYRLDEARAALGDVLLSRLASDNAARSELASRYAATLEGLDRVNPVLRDEPDSHSAWHIYPLLLDRATWRAAFRERLAAAGVQTSVHYPALHLTAAFAKPAGADLPATESYSARTVTVPMFPHMSEAQHARVIAAIADAMLDVRPG
jgi:dTDP-4-amino-4,6-dideoxygalactose transaminase